MNSHATSVAVPAHYETLFDQALAAAARRGEPDWLVGARRSAFDALRRAGFPTLRAEEWKYTDVRAVVEATPALPAHDGAAPAAPALPDLGPGARLVLVDGVYIPELSSPPTDTGIEVVCLDAAARNGQADLLCELLHSGLAECASPFVALHTALLSGGLFVRVRRGARPAHPVYIFAVTSGRQGTLLASPRLVVQLEPESALTLAQWHTGTEGRPAITNVATDLVVGAGAVLHYVKVQVEPPDATHFSFTHVRQAAGSRATLVDVSLGARLARHELATRLDGEGAATELLGLYALRQAQHADYHTAVDHRVPYCTTRQIYKGLIDDRARAVFNGKIFVRPGAKQTDAYQLNKTLLLSPRAVVDTKPQLEISNDDVKCTHGATVGQLDRGQVFYLQSRGIDRREAESILARGFVDEILLRVEHPALRERLRERLGHFFAAAEEHLHDRTLPT